MNNLTVDLPEIGIGEPWPWPYTYPYTYYPENPVYIPVMSTIFCKFCGKYHEGNCPNIKSMEFYENGQIKKIEFYKESEIQQVSKRTEEDIDET